MASRTAEKETKYLETVLKTRPDSLLFSRLADAYRKEGNIAQAIELCTTGLAHYPDYTTGRILLGRCYLEQQKYADAVEAFTAVCTHDRRNQVAIKMLADIFADQGMQEKAGDLYALLHAMDPGNSSITHLSSKHSSSGNNDLFAILGLGAATGVQKMAPQQYTGEPQQESFDAQGYDFPTESTAIPAGDFSESSAFGTDLPASSDDTFSGDDVLDRMDSLFGESPAGARDASAEYQLDAQAPEMDIPGNEDIESLIAGLSTDTGAVSGDDVSDRIGALFSESGSPASATGFNEHTPAAFDESSVLSTEAEPLASLSGQDFDFSGMDGTSENDPADEIDLQDTLSITLPEKDELDTAASLTNTDSLKRFTESPAPEFEAELLVPGEGDQDNGGISGDDFTNRLEDLFGESPKSTLTEDNTLFGADVAGEPQDIIENSVLNLQDAADEVDILQPEIDGADSVLELQLPESGFLSGSDSISPEENSTVSGRDLSDRLDDLFADDKADASDAGEPDLAMEFDIPEEELPLDLNLTFDPVNDIPDVNEDAFGFATEEALQPAGDADAGVTGLVPSAAALTDVAGTDIQDRLDEMFEGVNDEQSDQPSGDDVSDRINGIFALPQDASTIEPDDADELFVHDDRNLQTFDIREKTDGSLAMAEPDDASEDELFTIDSAVDADAEADIALEEPVRRDGSETTFDQLLPKSETFNEMFSGGAFETDLQDVVKDGATEGNEFMPAEFEETLQFDNALFEKMLNPDDDEAAPAEPQIYSAETGLNEIAAIVPENGNEADLPFDDSFELISAADLDKEDDDELQTIVDMDLSLSAADEEEPFTIDLVTEPEEENFLQPDDGPQELVLESTATFEVDALGMFSSKAGNDVAPDVSGTDDGEELIDLISDDSSYIERSKLNFTNQVVSDNTEILEVAPSGDDIVGKLDDMFPESWPHAPVAHEHQNVSAADEVVDLTKEYLLDDIAEITGSNDDDEENDAALIETMQMSSMADIPGFVPDEHMSTEEYDLISDAETLPAGGEIDSAQVTGSDIEARLDAFFPEADLLSLSRDNAPVFEEESEVSGEAVSDFYTLSGEDAVGSDLEEIPDGLEKVEFVDSDDVYEDQTVELQQADVEQALAAGAPETTFVEEMLSDTDFPQETIAMSMDTINRARMAPLDERDKPFDIPDHVLTPTLADIYFQQGQYRLALQVFERLLTLDPDNPKLLSRYHEVRSIAEQGIPVQQAKLELTPQKRPSIRLPKVDQPPKKEEKPLAGVKIKKTVKASHKHAPRHGRGESL